MFSFLSFEGFSIWDLVEAEFSVQCQVVKQMNGGGGWDPPAVSQMEAFCHEEAPGSVG